MTHHIEITDVNDMHRAYGIGVVTKLFEDTLAMTPEQSIERYKKSSSVTAKTKLNSSEVNQSILENSDSSPGGNPIPVSDLIKSEVTGVTEVTALVHKGCRGSI
jgi:hypothetical protein